MCALKFTRSGMLPAAGVGPSIGVPRPMMSSDGTNEALLVPPGDLVLRTRSCCGLSRAVTSSIPREVVRLGGARLLDCGVVFVVFLSSDRGSDRVLRRDDRLCVVERFISVGSSSG